MLEEDRLDSARAQRQQEEVIDQGHPPATAWLIIYWPDRTVREQMERLSKAAKGRAKVRWITC